MTVRLPRFFPGMENQPGLQARYWDEAMTTIESILNQILELPEIQAAIDAANAAAIAAQAAADNAQAAADGAQGMTDAQASENSIVNSYISGFTPPLISSDNLGNVTIATHSRVYGDSSLNPTVSVTGAVLATGAAAGATIRVYYVDAARAGGAVSYLFTTDPAAPPVQSGDTHSVGAVLIPVAGSQSGKTINPPGYVEL